MCAYIYMHGCMCIVSTLKVLIIIPNLKIEKASFHLSLSLSNWTQNQGFHSWSSTKTSNGNHEILMENYFFLNSIFVHKYFSFCLYSCELAKMTVHFVQNNWGFLKKKLNILIKKCEDHVQIFFYKIIFNSN